MTLPEENPNIHITAEESFAIVGEKGTGKTTLQFFLVQEGDVVWDPLGQYPASVSYRPAALDRAEFDALAGHVWSQAVAQNGPPPEVSKKRRRPRAPGKGMRLHIEECEQILPRGPPLPPVCKSLVMMGRNILASYGANSRRPQNMHLDLLDHADHLFMFKLWGRSLDYVIDYLGKRQGHELEVMDTWEKKSFKFFWRDPDGVLHLCRPLKLA